MKNTNVNSYTEALKIGNEFKQLVNERHRPLEIDFDDIYQRLLLHAEQKYLALQLIEVNGVLQPNVGVKELGMRRREYCAWSEEANRYWMNHIISGAAPELLIEKIHDYLRDKVRNGEFPVQKVMIYMLCSNNLRISDGRNWGTIKNIILMQNLNRKCKLLCVRKNVENLFKLMMLLPVS